MANHGGFFTNDTQASNKLPYFDGSNYGYWEQTMKSYIEALDKTQSLEDLNGKECSNLGNKSIVLSFDELTGNMRQVDLPIK